MQSSLFLLEEADAHRRNGKFHLALKRYMAVKKVRVCPFRNRVYVNQPVCRCLTNMKTTNLISMDITFENLRLTSITSTRLFFLLTVFN